MAFPPSTPVVDGVTVYGNAWWTAFLAELTSALQDAGHPTVTPAQAIAELITARGTAIDLDTRLLGVVDHAGNNLAQLSPRMTRNGFVWGNIGWNTGHVMWSRGDAAAPDGWTLSGTGAAIARCGSGQADTNVFTTNDTKNFSARLTYGSATARYGQQFVPAAVMAGTDGGFWEGERAPLDVLGNPLPGYGSVEENAEVYVICAVLTSGTNRARISIGGDVSIGGGAIYSNYHPGDSAFHWLVAGPFDLNSAVPTLNIQGHCESAGTAYFMDWMICPSSVGLSPTWLPEKPIARTHTFPIIATPTTGTGYGYFIPNRPVFITGIRAYVAGAVPTGTTLQLDLQTPIGGAFVSLFAAVPAFVASDRYLLKVPDPAAANYRRRTIRGITAAGSAIADNSILRLDVAARDGGATATNVQVEIDYLEFPRPFEQWRTQTDLGE